MSDSGLFLRVTLSGFDTARLWEGDLARKLARRLTAIFLVVVRRR